MTLASPPTVVRERMHTTVCARDLVYRDLVQHLVLLVGQPSRGAYRCDRCNGCLAQAYRGWTRPTAAERPVPRGRASLSPVAARPAS